MTKQYMLQTELGNLVLKDDLTGLYNRRGFLALAEHRIKVALPGYQTFETEVGLLAGQKSEVKTELVKGSIEQASSEIKNQK